MNVLSPQKQIEIIAALTEGCSIRSIERLSGVHRDTVMRLGVTIGDAWVFTAFAATQKAVISYVVGKRTSENAYALLADLEARILNRPQITADGYAPYSGAVREAFDAGRGCDFGQLIKIYEATPGNDSATRYSPGHIRAIEKEPVFGNPDEGLISTSYVERFNLTNRMAIRRFTRLTNAFSKKFENHRAAVSLHVAHYNLCRVHETLRTTPAMALGVSDHIWSIGELVDAARSEPKPAPSVPVPPAPTRPGPRGFQLRVIRGGKVR